MRVLVACEFSGAVRDAFIAKGHDAWSCDLLPGEGKHRNKHFQGDVFKVLRTDKNWDLLIAHPPCTYLCNSGVRWLHETEGRWAQMEEGARFFKRLLNTKIPRICIENPVMHKYAKEIIGMDFTQSIQPWQFGHGETKRTCFWLKGLPPLKPTKIVEGREQKIHLASPGPDRWKIRSMTYPGIAKAMAAQWGKL